MVKNIPRRMKTINLYSAIVTLLAVALLILLLKQCNEPVAGTAEIRNLVDSFRFKEKLADMHIDKLATLVDQQDSIIGNLQSQKAKTRVVYKEQMRVVEQAVAAAPTACDSLKKEVNTLMELAADYEVQADSISLHYETKLHYTDSIALMRQALYADLKSSFDVVLKVNAELSAKIQTVQQFRKKERWLYAAAGIVAAILVIKK